MNADGGALDPTLRQVLSELYHVANERDQYRAVLVALNQKLEDPAYLLERLNQVQAQVGETPGAVSSAPASEASE